PPSHIYTLSLHDALPISSRICDATSEPMAARAIGVEGAESDIEAIGREAPLILRAGEFRQAYCGAAMAVGVATTRVHHMVLRRAAQLNRIRSSGSRSPSPHIPSRRTLQMNVRMSVVPIAIA